MMTRPPRCGRCGASLAAVPGEDEALDVDGHVVVGFLTCPGCGALYVYQRAVACQRAVSAATPRRGQLPLDFSA